MNKVIAFENEHPVLNGVLDLAAKWLRRHRAAAEARKELAACDAHELRRIADDLGTSVSSLVALSAKGPDAAAELPRMLAALGIDEKLLAARAGMVLREMQRLCAGCGRKGRCRRALAAGTAALGYRGYCPNAYTLAALTQR